MKLPFLLFLILGFSARLLHAQHDTIILRSVKITGDRSQGHKPAILNPVMTISAEEIAATHARDLPALLDMLPDVDLRHRGPLDVQSDLSIRGGSFEQTLVLINGIPFNDPQTGHHNMNLPFSLSNIERIEVFSGSGARFYGANAMTGAVNIITKKNTGLVRAADAASSVGSYGTFSGEAALQFRTGKTGHYLSAARQSSDGYTANTDMRRVQLWLSSTRSFQRVQLSLQGGWMNKHYGANSFYSARFPDQAEEISSGFASLQVTGGNKISWQANMHHKLHADRFELFRYEAPEWYTGHNYHRSWSGGAALSGETTWRPGKSRMGVAFRREGIISNVLGEDIDSVEVPGTTAWYHKGAIQDFAELWADHQVKLGRFTLSGGTLLFITPGQHSGWYPGASLNFRVTRRFDLFAGMKRSFRLPTFTDLYYKGPTNIGNPGLTREEANGAEAGFSYGMGIISAKGTVFIRDNRNLIDWVKSPGEVIWEAQNLTKIRTIGASVVAEIRPVKSRYAERISMSWSWLDQAKKRSDTLISYYILDHLKHKISISGDHQICETVQFSWNGVWQQRAGSYTSIDGEESPYPDVFILNAGISYAMTKVIGWNIRVNNVMNSKHFDFSGVMLPGRWFEVQLKIHSPF